MVTLVNARLVDPEGDRVVAGGVVIAEGRIAEVFEDLRAGLEGADVVMMLRLQRERMDGALIPSMREYYHRFGLDAEKLSSARADAIVMHPGPMNRGVEIDGLLADDINVSVIQEQVEMGVAVRMAAMDLLARNLRESNSRLEHG
jgi:aspartate carbamoyltransferase catalytic subunit